MTRANTAFTLVELLVVVTIIVILIGLLVPSLEQAKNAAEAVKCGTNLRGVGQAESQYLTDNRRTYPTTITWNMLFGNWGDGGYTETSYDTSKHWPLNPYLGVTANNAIVRIAECPSDAGDHAQGRPHAYTGYGTSYLIPWEADYSRVKKVYGKTNDPVTFPSMKSSQISRTSNKVLVADWVWHSNRSLANQWTKWHSNDKRLLNTLFADYHVELLDWDNEHFEFAPWNSMAPNPSHIFW